MFSFRTTPLQDQLDKALTEGKVGVFCTPSCWDAVTGKYLYEHFAERGNLAHTFLPEDGHIPFDLEDITGLDAVVVEIQDVGSRYFPYTVDVLRLMNAGRISPTALKLWFGAISSVSCHGNTLIVWVKERWKLDVLSARYTAELERELTELVGHKTRILFDVDMENEGG